MVAMIDINPEELNFAAGSFDVGLEGIAASSITGPQALEAAKSAPSLENDIVNIRASVGDLAMTDTAVATPSTALPAVAPGQSQEFSV